VTIIDLTGFTEVFVETDHLTVNEDIQAGYKALAATAGPAGGFHFLMATTAPVAAPAKAVV
jgi:hypothetical protein